MQEMMLTEAKEFFMSMNGSGYGMFREDQRKYDLYLALKISKETENTWREEKLMEYHKKMEHPQTEDKVWAIFNQMYNLTENMENSQSVNIMEKALNTIRDYLIGRDRIIVAETIAGKRDRMARDGLIYLSFDLKDKAKAKFFADQALALLNVDFGDETLSARSQRVRIRCNEIIRELEI
jgi:hypothetical protein